VVDIGGEPYAIPLTRLVAVTRLSKEQVGYIEGHPHFRMGNEQVGLVRGDQVLEVDLQQALREELAVVVLGDKTRRYGLIVDCIRSELELVVVPLDQHLGKVTNITAGAILPDRSPVLIIDVDDLLRSIEQLALCSQLTAMRHTADTERTGRSKRVLVVDDSLTVRELQRKVLSSRGYDVQVAVDGMDGWNSVRSSPYDLVITDVDMPRLDGIELVSLIKKDAKLSSLPVMIVSYKDREEDRRRGLDAGADYYLTKASFHDESLIQAVTDLIGSGRVA
jgi:two-component system sensor histidine kinase and response regulator WspE